MLAGHVPFDGDSAIDILHKHCMFPPPSLHEAAPHLPEHVCAAIERALSKNGSERFNSVSDFIAALKDPDFQEKPAARASVATVVMSAAEAKAARSAATTGKPGGSTDPSAKTVAAKPGSPVARPKPAAAAPAPAPQRKSKAPLIAAALAVLVGGGGFAAWQLTKGEPTPPASLSATPPSAQPQTPPASPPPATTTDPAGPGTVAGAGTKAADPVATPPAPDSKATTPTTKAPAPRQTPPPRQTTTPPRQTATQGSSTQTQPTTTPATQPAGSGATPATPTGDGGTPAGGGLGSRGIVRVRISPPATVLVDLISRGERSAIIDTLPAGQHLIRVQKDGYVTRDTAVVVRAGETITLPTITLQRTP